MNSLHIKKGEKSLQKESEYAKYDVDGDGIVSDEEMATIHAINAEAKSEAQKQMAWVAMISMLVFTLMVFLPIFPDGRIKALADLFGLFYIGQAGVVGAYMGMTAYMSNGKR
tara:strand:+ start:1218 stop:1553 length:336 start_codon:yes stop_codon:yes gene_type:complete